VSVAGNLPNGDVRDAAVQVLLDKAPPRILDFVSRVQSWSGVEVQRGRSVKRADGMTSYIRFSRDGRTFMYLKPGHQGGRAEMRLLKKAAANASHARARDVKATNPYQVRARPSNDAAVEEAFRLAEAAYKAAK